MSESSTLPFPHHGEAERWLPVVGYEGLYEVSDWGRVRSIPRIASNGHHLRGCLRKLQRDSHGVVQVSLYNAGRGETRSVHHLVLEAFVGLCPPGMECRHGPGGRQDNRLANLCWGTKSDNCGPDKIRDGVINWGERNGSAKLTEANVVEIRRRYAAGETQKLIAQTYGVKRQAVSRIIRGEGWAHVTEGAGEVRSQVWPSGEVHGKAKLTWAAVEDCRNRYAAGETQSALAREYGVSTSAVHLVVHGKNWAGKNPSAA